MSRQARPQLSKSWSEAKGTCDPAWRREPLGSLAEQVDRLASQPAVVYPISEGPIRFKVVCQE